MSGEATISMYNKYEGVAVGGINEYKCVDQENGHFCSMRSCGSHAGGNKLGDTPNKTLRLAVERATLMGATDTDLRLHLTHCFSSSLSQSCGCVSFCAQDFFLKQCLCVCVSPPSSKEPVDSEEGSH